MLFIQDHDAKLMKVLWGALAILLVLTLMPIAEAQIYKWKDERGRWQFSDKPPADETKAKRVVGVLNWLVADTQDLRDLK